MLATAATAIAVLTADSSVSFDAGERSGGSFGVEFSGFQPTHVPDGELEERALCNRSRARITDGGDQLSPRKKQVQATKGIETRLAVLPNGLSCRGICRKDIPKDESHCRGGWNTRFLEVYVNLICHHAHVSRVLQDGSGPSLGRPSSLCATTSRCSGKDSPPSTSVSVAQPLSSQSPPRVAVGKLE